MHTIRNIHPQHRAEHLQRDGAPQSAWHSHLGVARAAAARPMPSVPEVPSQLAPLPPADRQRKVWRSSRGVGLHTSLRDSGYLQQLRRPTPRQLFRLPLFQEQGPE